MARRRSSSNSRPASAAPLVVVSATGSSHWANSCWLGSGEGLEPVDGIQSVELIISGLRSGRVVGQDIRGKVELIGDENQYLPWHDFAGLQQAAGEPQGTELDGKAQAIVRPPAPRDDGEVSRAECVMPDQVGLGRRQREQCFKLGVGDGATTRHGGSVPIGVMSVQSSREPSRSAGFRAAHAGMLQLGQKAAIYCRVSTADQSCERQERDLRAFAERAAYEVVGVFKETGSGAKLDRVERRKVMALAQARHVDAVLVTELSRWGRSTLDLLETLRELGGAKGVGGGAERHDLRSGERDRAHDGHNVGRYCRVRTGSSSGAGAIGSRRCEGERQGARTAAWPASEIRSLGPQGPRPGRRRPELSAIGRELGLSKNTVADIVKRNRGPDSGSRVA